jgi:peptide/nickel transport system substrate-binding protein
LDKGRLARQSWAGLLVLGLLAGCTKVDRQSGSAGASNTWTRPGHFVYGQAQDIKSLNPMLATSAAALDLSMFLFSWAVRYDERSQPHPDALRELPTVENGDVSKDGLTLKYKLRPNIYFHDNVQLTCRDLKFTWRAVMNPANNDITQDGYRDIKDIDCADPLVALIHMKRVYAPFLQELWGVNGNAPILPAHILEKYNDAKGSFNTAPFQSAPVGSGPFSRALRRSSSKRSTGFISASPSWTPSFTRSSRTTTRSSTSCGRTRSTWRSTSVRTSGRNFRTFRA